MQNQRVAYQPPLQHGVQHRVQLLLDVLNQQGLAKREAVLQREAELLVAQLGNLSVARAGRKMRRQKSVRWHVSPLWFRMQTRPAMG
jgi:hypothetical protein